MQNRQLDSTYIRHCLLQIPHLQSTALLQFFSSASSSMNKACFSHPSLFLSDLAGLIKAHACEHMFFLAAQQHVSQLQLAADPARPKPTKGISSALQGSAAAAAAEPTAAATPAVAEAAAEAGVKAPAQLLAPQPAKPTPVVRVEPAHKQLQSYLPGELCEAFRNAGLKHDLYDWQVEQIRWFFKAVNGLLFGSTGITRVLVACAGWNWVFFTGLSGFLLQLQKVLVPEQGCCPTACTC